MKKFLSLVLALVMTMSLVTISAGAKDFTDDDSITYKEAVDVISGIGVVDGYTGGDFKPDGVLTRGAAAKLGLINGYADGTFRPQEGLTRAAAASLLYRSLVQNEKTPGKSVQVPVLMYHDVSYLGYGYSKTPEIFKKQMQELKNAGFHTVFFSQLIDFVEQGTPLPDKPIVISIDDGYATNYT